MPATPSPEPQPSKIGSGPGSVAVIGGGLAGLTAALALARAFEKPDNADHSPDAMQIHLIAPSGPSSDKRTTAFLHHSVGFMEQLGVWPEVEEHAFALKTMRIVDATKRLIRAPQVEFHAAEINLEAFGYNVENRLVIEELERQLASCRTVVRHDCLCGEVTFRDNGLAESVVTESGKTIDIDLVIGADGRNSLVREAANIGVSNWHYDQVALVLNLSHTLPHHDVSTEFHTETGPFTLVPLGPEKSSLVWVVHPDERQAVLAMDRRELENLLEEKMQSFLGTIAVDSPLQGFALSGMMAKRLGRDNLVLVGEAAHVFPPIGAQGFNLGIRDIEEVVRLVRQGVAPAAIGEQYHRARLGDVKSRTASVDLLNRSLLSSFLPVQLARSLAISVLAGIPPLRQLAMRQGVEPNLSEFSPLSFARNLFGKGPTRFYPGRRNQ